MPGYLEYRGQRLPASYANFYIANEIVIIPTFRDPRDAKALEILQREFPDRRVIGVDSVELIWGTRLVPLPQPAGTGRVEVITA